MSLPPWGEAVDCRVRARHKLEARWSTGIFCGIRLNTTEKVVATENGIVVVQSIRRKPKEFRWDPDLFKKVKGTPWAPVPGRAARPEEAQELPEVKQFQLNQTLPDEPAKEAVSAERSEAPRRVYIRQTDLDKHGYTASCPACDLIRAGVSREGAHQTEFCRARLVGKLEETAEGRRRLDAAKRKEGPSKVRKVEKPDERSEDRSTVSVPGPGSGSRSAEKREAEEPSSQEASPPKTAHSDSSKRARVESKGESVRFDTWPQINQRSECCFSTWPRSKCPRITGHGSFRGVHVFSEEVVRDRGRDGDKLPT